MSLFCRLFRSARIERAREAWAEARDAYRNACQRKDTRGKHRAAQDLKSAMTQRLKAEVGA